MPRAEAKYVIRAEDQTAPGIRSAEGRIERLRRGALRSLRGGLTRLSGPIAAVGTAIAGWGAGILRAAEQLDELAKSAKDLGQSVEDTAALQLGAELQGSDLQTVTRVVERFATASAEAAEGTAEYAEAFDQLQLNAAAFGRLSPAQQISVFGRALQRIEDPAQRAALRQRVAGRRVGRLFEGDVEGAFGEAGRLGLTRDLDRQAQDAEEVTDAWTRFKAVLSRQLQRSLLIPARPLARALNAAAETAAVRSTPTPELSGSFSLAEQEALQELKRIRRASESGLGGARLG